MPRRENIALADVSVPGLPNFIRAIVRVEGNSVNVRLSSLGMSVIIK